LLKGDLIYLEFIYDKETLLNNQLDPNRYYAIDLGIDNLATVASNCSKSFIVNGKPIKQIN